MRKRKSSVRRHSEHHHVERTGWLRAAVLGANDGILSTAGLLVGVAAASASRDQLRIAGIAGIVAGAMSMGAGEYVSVSSQADAEKADLEIERRELATNAEAERAELAGIYVKRGLDPALASQVAVQLMRHDALGAHARDELGLTSASKPRPVQAAVSSAAAFTTGALLPLIVSVTAPLDHVALFVAVSSLLSLGLLGATAAWTGGAPPARGAARVVFWGALAMGLTSILGKAIGTSIGW